MNPSFIFTGVLSCLLLLFTLTQSYTVSGNNVNDALLAHASDVLPNEIVSVYQDDSSDEHEFEKRRFNAWAGKRSLLAKRRFNAWAGRR